MKLILTIFITLILSGCTSICEQFVEPKTIYLPVYKVPEFEIPARPTLKTTGESSLANSKNVEQDLVELSSYSMQLENLLKTIKNFSGNNK